MKKVVDTNPVICACIIQDYKTKILNYFQSSDSLIILSIADEIKDKLLKVHTCLLGLENFSSIKGNKKLLLPFFKDIKDSSKQIYNYIKNSKDVNLAILLKNLQKSVGILLSEISRLPTHPRDDRTKNKIIITNEKDLASKLPKIKINDLKHLYLMHNYTQNFASKIDFYTEDKEDYLNNNKEIEKVLKDIKILDFKNFK